jgi:hypothetical protein
MEPSTIEVVPDLTKLIDVGGNFALLIAVYYINQSSRYIRLVAERLARIESKLSIEPQSEPKE